MKLKNVIRCYGNNQFVLEQSNLSLEEAIKCKQDLEEEFAKYGFKFRIVDIDEQIDYFMYQEPNNPIKTINMNPNAICCPRCGSTSITTGARGVNWMLGLIGASKTVNRCANCGHMWEPRK